jgi:beta-glucosidase
VNLPARTGEGDRNGARAAGPTLERCLEGHEFLWLTGIEDTFITAPDKFTGRTLDEYALTGHYDEWESDFALAHELGVTAMRYGIPWHRINPEKNVWDFAWTDAALERLSALGIQPIVDLVHYGLPGWMEGAFLHPDYERYVEEYAVRVAERYRGRIFHYTPLNEPRITAWYCGKLGLWPPYRRGDKGFVAVLAAICRGIVTTERALRAVDPRILCVHADASDVYEAGERALLPEAAFRQSLVFLALDFITGRVEAAHPLVPWLLRSGLEASTLDWFGANATPPDVVGINVYPMFSLKVLERAKGRVRIRMPFADAGLVERLLGWYAERYELPVMVSETASRGSFTRRRAWLAQSVAAVARARRRGVRVVGYTFWPMFALVRWAYLRGRHPAAAYVEQMGLWDLEPESAGRLRRVRTPLVDDFRALVAGGASAVGPLGARPREAARSAPAVPR